MRPAARVAAFGAALGVVFGAAALAGASVDTLREETSGAGHGHGAADGAHGAGSMAAAAPGLAVAEGGLRLAPETTPLPLGRPAELAFRVLDADGAPVTGFDVEHERRMHLIVVRRDLTGYQHLHPRMDATGRWSVRVRLPEAGVYRAYAATLTAHDPVAGADTEIEYDLSRDGRRLDAVQPYLGADGHLVALREGDLAFLHVHPEDSGEPGTIRFGASLPSPGRYRLFLQFKHDGAIHTVAHTLVVTR